MRIADILGHENFRQMLDDMCEPGAKPPRDKGPDAIPVRGYVVPAFWRRRWRPTHVSNDKLRRRRRSRALTPSELEAAQQKE